MKRFSYLVAGLALAAGLVLPAAAQVRSGQRIAVEATNQFHAEAGDVQLWSDTNYDALILAINNLSRHGLNPAHYHLEQLTSLRENEAGRDRIATSAFFMAATHLAYGNLDPVSVEPDWTVINHPHNPGPVLRYALAQETIGSTLEQFAPIQPGYHTLLDELARLRAQTSGTRTLVSGGATLREGNTGDRVSALQTRLKELGFLTEDFDVSGNFDADTRLAVETF